MSRHRQGRSTGVNCSPEPLGLRYRSFPVGPGQSTYATRATHGAAIPLGVIVSLALVSTPGCGGADSSSHRTTASAAWTVGVPDARPLSLAQSLRVIRSADGPNSLDVADASAAVFALGKDRLDTSHPEWRRLVRKVCGSDGLLDEALAAGWMLTVTGFVDSTGPVGAGTLNDRLQRSRADRAAHALIAECRIPKNRIQTRKGGVGGAGRKGRRITVTYTRRA